MSTNTANFAPIETKTAGIREAQDDLPNVPPQVLAFCGLFFVVLLLNLVIYASVLKAPFVFDSVQHIRNNPGLDQWQIGGTRWLAMASFAFDRQLHGDKVWGYHLTSIAVHALATFLVFWTVFVTLGFKAISRQLFAQRVPVASFSAVLWSVHPLQTQPVMYTVQRMETLMALFFIAAILMFALALKSRVQIPYLLCAAAFYFASTGCKEVAIALPPVLLVFDFVFSQQEPVGSFLKRLGQIFKARAWFYILLVMLSFPFASSLTQVTQKLPIAYKERVDVVAENRSDVIDVAGLTPINYLTTQAKVIVKYVALACLPVGQNFDHGMEVSQRPFDKYFFPGALIAIAVVGLIGVARRWTLGFCITAFLLILVPTSSFVPIRDLMVEHRMYLPLVFVIVAICSFWFTTLSNQQLAIAMGVLMCVLLTGISAMRVQVYRSGVAIWSDSFAKNPDNPRALAGLAQSYYEGGNFQKSIQTFERAIELNQSRVRVPTLMTVQEMRYELSEVQNNYAIVLTRNKNYADAKKLLDSAIENAPRNAAAHSSLGNVYAKLKNNPRAIECYQAALEIDPNMGSAKKNLELITQASSNPQPNPAP